MTRLLEFLPLLGNTETEFWASGFGLVVANILGNGESNSVYVCAGVYVCTRTCVDVCVSISVSQIKYKTGNFSPNDISIW